MSESTDIFYFSGTGNSLALACHIAEELPDCTVRKMTDYDGEKILADRVGVIFPTYMCGLPLYVAEFLEKLNVEKGKYIFAAATYGSLSGKVLPMADNILKKRNLKLSAGFLVHMPDNYIIAYNPPSKRKAERMYRKEKIRAQLISQYVGYMKSGHIEKSRFGFDAIITDFLYKKIKDIPQSDENFRITENCNCCGKCERNCPVGNIVLENGKPEWQHKCQGCLACVQRCPSKAIEIGNSTKHRKRYVHPIYQNNNT